MRGLWHGHVRRRLAVVLALAAAISLFGAADAAQAASTTITASEDTYTSQGNAAATHGSSGSLTVNGPPGERRAYVKFDRDRHPGRLN